MGPFGKIGALTGKVDKKLLRDGTLASGRVLLVERTKVVCVVTLEVTLEGEAPTRRSADRCSRW
ncbi:MAG: hypothetical protein MUP97_00025 [Acidimicrobiia bacterium]|nr:hypothetical protein [Acidimicrobiia bacterium]